MAGLHASKDELTPDERERLRLLLINYEHSTWMFRVVFKWAAYLGAIATFYFTFQEKISSLLHWR